MARSCKPTVVAASIPNCLCSRHSPDARAEPSTSQTWFHPLGRPCYTAARLNNREFTNQSLTSPNEGALRAVQEESLSSDFNPHEPRFSPVLTVLAALVLLAAALAFGWLMIAVPSLERVPVPERALALMVDRMMDLEEAFARAPAWERQLYDVTMGNGINELAQAITWYEELAAYSSDPLVQLRLAVLEAEAGRLDLVRARIKEWEGREDPFPSFVRLIQAGYLEPRTDPAVEMALQAELAELLPGGWFYDRLAMNLAMRAGHRTLLASIEQASASRVAPLLRRTRELLAVELPLILSGALVLLVVLVRQRGRLDALKVGKAPLPPLWRGRTGLVVMIRGGAIGAVLALGLLFLEMDNPLLRIMALPVTNLPLLVLAYRHLLKPTGLGFGGGLGLWPSSAGWVRCGLAVPAVVAVGLLGEWGVSLATDALSLSSHWTEWFDSDLVWGSSSVLAVSLLEYVGLAPVFEEIVFRGLLFATLRRKFGWGASALISGMIFAMAHGYGMVGFVSVFWSGLLWAWAYEKTGSLIPGIVAHMLNNLMVCLTVIWLLRF